MPSRPQKPWFALKRYGYGAGMPITWQGWALLALFFAIVTLANIFLDQGARTAAILTAAVLLAVVAAFKTNGGWRWR
ncbi:hypothetical protein GCM10022253_08120 [Sphingomonas endophytica]